MYIPSRKIGHLTFFDNKRPGDVMDMFFAEHEILMKQGNDISKKEADHYFDIGNAICDAFPVDEQQTKQSFMIEGTAVYDKREYPEHWEGLGLPQTYAEYEAMYLKDKDRAIKFIIDKVGGVIPRNIDDSIDGVFSFNNSNNEITEIPIKICWGVSSIEFVKQYNGNICAIFLCNEQESKTINMPEHIQALSIPDILNGKRLMKGLAK